MSVFFWRRATVAEVVARWVPAEVQAQYGISPMMQALPMLKASEELPADERSAAIRTYVGERLSDPTDEWWP